MYIYMSCLHMVLSLHTYTYIEVHICCGDHKVCEVLVQALQERAATVVQNSLKLVSVFLLNAD